MSNICQKKSFLSRLCFKARASLNWLRCELHKCTTGHYKLFIYKKIVILFFGDLLVADFVCWSSRSWHIHIFTICLNTSTNGTTKTDTYERKSNFVLLSLQNRQTRFPLRISLAIWNMQDVRATIYHFLVVLVFFSLFKGKHFL